MAHQDFEAMNGGFDGGDIMAKGAGSEKSRILGLEGARSMSMLVYMEEETALAVKRRFAGHQMSREKVVSSGHNSF